jgi:hypothetical protein
VLKPAQTLCACHTTPNLAKRLDGGVFTAAFACWRSSKRENQASRLRHFPRLQVLLKCASTRDNPCYGINPNVASPSVMPTTDTAIFCHSIAFSKDNDQMLIVRRLARIRLTSLGNVEKAKPGDLVKRIDKTYKGRLIATTVRPSP